MLRLMTHNVWNRDENVHAWKEKGEDCSAGARIGGLMRVWKETCPDIIGGQEFSRLMAELVKGEFEKEGKNYALIWGRFTPILYLPEKLELLDTEFLTYPEELPGYEGEFNDVKSKACNVAVFRVKETGNIFVFATTHLWWKTEPSEPTLANVDGNELFGSDKAREYQIALAIEKIEKYTKSINSDLLYEYIETKLIKGSDYERIEALQAIKIVDSALRNKLVKVVLNYVRYVQTTKTSDFIDTISDLIVAGKLSRSVWKKRIDSVLLSIANSIADLVGEEELRMDVMHATNMLAGIVDAKWGETAGTRKWKAITNDRTQFNDVRIAFDLGQSRVIENKDELFEKLILKEG